MPVIVISRPLDDATDIAACSTGEPTLSTTPDSAQQEVERPSRASSVSTELIKRHGPWRGADDLEYATAEWVD